MDLDGRVDKVIAERIIGRVATKIMTKWIICRKQRYATDGCMDTVIMTVGIISRDYQTEANT